MHPAKENEPGDYPPDSHVFLGNYNYSADEMKKQYTFSTLLVSTFSFLRF